MQGVPRIRKKETSVPYIFGHVSWRNVGNRWFFSRFQGWSRSKKCSVWWSVAYTFVCIYPLCYTLYNVAIKLLKKKKTRTLPLVLVFKSPQYRYLNAAWAFIHVATILLTPNRMLTPCSPYLLAAENRTWHSWQQTYWPWPNWNRLLSPLSQPGKMWLEVGIQHLGVAKLCK